MSDDWFKGRSNSLEPPAPAKGNSIASKILLRLSGDKSSGYYHPATSSSRSGRFDRVLGSLNAASGSIEKRPEWSRASSDNDEEHLPEKAYHPASPKLKFDRVMRSLNAAAGAVSSDK